MKHRLKNIDQQWKVYALAGCAVVLFAACIFNLGPIWKVISGFFRIMSPVIIGFIIAYIMNPLTMLLYKKVFGKIRNKNIKWPLSVVSTIIVLIAIVVILSLLLIPQIVASVVSLMDNYEGYLNSFKNFVDNNSGIFDSLPAVSNFINSLTVEGGFMTKAGELLSQNVSTIIEKTASAGTTALNVILGLIFAIYFLLAKRGIKRGSKKLTALALSHDDNKRLLTILDKFNNIFSKYIVFELLDALIIGVANYIFMIILNMPNAILISVIMALTNLVPTFGPIVGVGIASFILLLVEPTAVIPLLIFTLVSQLADSYLVKPNLFGNALNVPGVLILIAIIVFGKILGVAGMLLAIPFVAFLVYLYQELFLNWLKRRKESNEAEAGQVAVKEETK